MPQRPRRRPISWDALLEGQGLASFSGPDGRVLRLPLALGHSFVARSDEIFASPSGVVHPVHCLTRRDVALYKERWLTSLQWYQATSIEVRFRGHKGDHAQRGSVIVRTRDDASGTRFGAGEGSGAVALMVELLSLCIRRCRKASPCRRIGVVMRLECGGTRRPSRHFARWKRRQEMIPAKSGSTHCVSVQPLRWRPGGRCHRG